MKTIWSAVLVAVSAIAFLPASQNNTVKNDIPPRFQWNSNLGYCGEVSLISAGLYYGQYISQYQARVIAGKGAPQNKCQLLLGRNDYAAAAQMHLEATEWNTSEEQNTDQFLAWVKQNVVKGYPVAIGIYTNEYLFYDDTDPDAGDSEYDHIVPVTAFSSNHPLRDPAYYGDDIIFFSDNGLWGDPNHPQYNFSYSAGEFQADRRQANAENGPIYSISNDGDNYGIAITGVMDLDGDTLPVRVTTNVNYEKPEIQDGSNTQPVPMPVVLTITISGLQPNVAYNLYRYNDLSLVPNSHFNGRAHNAYQHWQIEIISGSTYVMTQQIDSDEVAVYRAVKAIAP